MMKTAILATLICGASAFAPSKSSARSTSLNADLSKELGAMAPLGFWDPLNLCNDGDQELFDNLRYVELKHGRVAMLAVVGYLATKSGARLPGYEDVSPGLAALKTMPGDAWLWVAVSVLALEINMRDATGDSQFIGDYRNGFDFGWDKQSDEWKMKKRTIELNNGRAAQMGILGLMVHESMGNLDDVLPL